MRDVFTLLQTTEYTCLDKGFVRLVDVMPRMIPDTSYADYSIAQMARVSYGDGTKSIDEDRGLIRYLMRHRHTSPFEGVEFKFHMKLPIFVARQAIRHRTANLNEYSGRYSVMKDEFFFPKPEDLRVQSTTNKQSSEGTLDESKAIQYCKEIEEFCDKAYDLYLRMVNDGVGRELARMVLPVNIYTEWYWKCDLHNLLHFIALRADSHAQQEIRVYANAMLNLITPIVPWTVEAFNDYHPMRDGMLLTRLEVDRLKKIISGDNLSTPISENKRESKEWDAKLESLLP